MKKILIQFTIMLSIGIITMADFLDVRIQIVLLLLCIVWNVSIAIQFYKLNKK